jgi:4'-phosphopantetheinyl transferase
MLKIYYIDISNFFYDENLLTKISPFRKDYILSINDSTRKKQSLYVWLLLEFVLKSLNVKIKSNLSINNGKWFLIDESCFFSLSHSNNIVCIAISDKNVGVDVEICSDKTIKTTKKYFKEVAFSDNNLYIQKWTEKEAMYKFDSDDEKIIFSSKTVQDLDKNVYILTSCAKETAEFYQVEILDILDHYKGD